MRRRKLSLTRTIGLLLHLAAGSRTSSQNAACVRLFEELEILGKTPTARSSITEARQKVPWQALEHLLHKAVVDEPSWFGHNAYAVDGSYVRMPKSAEIMRNFPMRTTGEFYPSCRLFCAFHISTLQPVQADVSSVFKSEHDQLRNILNRFKSGDVLVLDRGFHSLKLWKEITDHNLNFICRIRQGSLAQRAGRSKDCILKVGNQKLRVVRLKKLFVITNFIDPKHTREELLKLYKKRWVAETQFRQLKQNLNLQKFHAKTMNGIMQEIFASLLIASLTTLVAFKTAPSKIINHSLVIDIVSRHLKVFISGSKKAIQAFLRIAPKLIEFAQKPRPGRAFPRFSKQPENKWIKARRTNNHVAKGHWRHSDRYR